MNFASDRRRFILGTCAAGGSAMFGRAGIGRADPPPEIDRIRLVHSPSICLAPQYVAEELLHLEGFAQVEYVSVDYSRASRVVAGGKADLSMETAPSLIPSLDSTRSVVAIGGIHAGCYELFGHESVHAVHDLKGARIAISMPGGADHMFVASILAYVGIDPRTDVQWVVAGKTVDTMTAFLDRRADAFLGFPPQPQQMRARNLGRVILDIGRDRPWSQYLCCMITANHDFTRQRPVACKRALRAILKAADMCVEDPERVARFMVLKGYEPRYEIALETLKSLPYGRWRDTSPEDTLRFHALRLHDVGMIKTPPHKLIAQGTDWRFLNELKRELKA